MLVIFLVLFSFVLSLCTYLPPLVGLYAADSDMFPPQSNHTLSSCSDWCTATPNCISFNLCGDECGIQSWSMSYTPKASSGCSWYRRSIPRNDSPAPRAVPWVAALPAPQTVTLSSGPIADAFVGNLVDYLKLRDPEDMLYWFAWRSGANISNAQCFGWDGWIKGSATGNYLMGAGSYLQWAEDAELRAGVERVVGGIREYQDNETGWVWAWKESDMMDAADNLPDYCAGWVTRGLIDASAAGVPDALQLARDSISLFNNHSSLPWILPQNGGPSPVSPYPAGFNNVTDGGYGQNSGHMIYIEYQGLIKHTLMALSDLGTEADVDIVRDLYTEDWWLTALLSEDLFHGIWHRQFFSHNYEITAFEAFLDMYILTGNVTYFTAMQNAWRALREHWILPGGSFALNEGSYYPPDSYYIGFTGRHVSASHGHSASASNGQEDDPYFHSKCMFHPGGTSPNSSEIEASTGSRRMSASSGLPAPPRTPSGPNDNDPPTGELCGNVFWSLFNQRFHRLDPNNETYVWEIERSILNVGLAALGREGSGGEGPGGRGIRYFANQHKQKQFPSMHASCCEGQGTRLFGSLPSFLFSLEGFGASQPTVRVNIYAESSISLPGGGLLLVHTNWPYSSSVMLNLTLPKPSDPPQPPLTLALRMPAWLPAPQSITLNGSPTPTPGIPGTYVHISLSPASWGTSSTLSFNLPMVWSVAQYKGSSQLPPYTRYSYLYGPVLMSIQGPWDTVSDSLVMPKDLDPLSPQVWTSQSPGSLSFNVTNHPGFSMKPYFQVQDVSETQTRTIVRISLYTGILFD